MSTSLRPATSDDIEFYYQLQQDQVGVWMAAFTSADLVDRAAFQVRWSRVLADPTIVLRTALVGDEPVGQVLKHVSDDGPEVSFWIAREHWGHGHATEAVRLLLLEVPERPLFARAASDNLGSLAVLRHNGFVATDTTLGFAEARGEMISETVLTRSHA